MRIALSVLSLLAVSCPKVAWGVCAGASPSWTAASLAQTDVADCIAASADGDTITLPAGSSPSWSARLEVTQSNLTIQGQGPASTTINGYGFLLSGSSNGARITGIHFAGGDSTPIIRVSSGTDYGGTPITGWVIDGNQFSATGSGGISVFNGSTGLIADNRFLIDAGTTIYVYGRDDDDWAAAPFAGLAGRYVFVEDNRFEATGSSANHAIMSSWGGSYVFRCNEVTHDDSSGATYKDMIDVHGYGHGTGRRSGRAVEIYGNHLDNDNYSSRTFNFRGGTGRVFTNRWSSDGTSVGLTDYRMASHGLSMAYPTDTADCGTNSETCPSDGEATCCADHEGYPCCDQVGRGQDGAGGARQGGDPFYFWDNRTDGLVDVAIDVSAGTPAANIQLDRDYFVGAPPDGYEPYVYPHPDRGLAATTTCLAADSSEAQTGITFWTAAAGGAGGSAGAGTGGTGGGIGSGGSAGDGGSGATLARPTVRPEEEGSCGCRTAGQSNDVPRPAWLLGLGLGLAITRRRCR